MNPSAIAKFTSAKSLACSQRIEHAGLRDEPRDSVPPHLRALVPKARDLRIARPCAWLTAAVRYSGPRCTRARTPSEQRQWTARTKLSAAAEREGHHVAPARKQGRREAWTAVRGIRRVRVRRWLPESRPLQRDVGDLGEARPVPGADRRPPPQRPRRQGVLPVLRVFPGSSRSTTRPWRSLQQVPSPAEWASRSSG